MDATSKSFYFVPIMENKVKKSKWLAIGLIFVFFISTFSFGFDITEFIKRKEINIPDWYFYLLFVVDLVFIASLFLIYSYRKIGTFLYPASIFTHFLFNNYYLNAFLYFDIFILFLFFSVILFLIVPIWDSFK